MDIIMLIVCYIVLIPPLIKTYNIAKREDASIDSKWIGKLLVYIGVATLVLLTLAILFN